MSTETGAIADVPRHQVDQFAIRALPDGGFVMELADARQDAVRLEFPAWMLPQLMRVLPQLDAAMQGDGDSVAYPLAQWSIDASRRERAVVLRLRDDRFVEAGFRMALEDARALHGGLGEAIARAEPAAPPQ